MTRKAYPEQSHTRRRAGERKRPPAERDILKKAAAWFTREQL
jgi:hypothetical protein